MIGSTTESCKNEPRMEFDIHGVIGIRLVDPSSADVTGVRHQLGSLQLPLLHEPDITVRFVKRLSPPHLRYLGPKQRGFSDDAFFILDQSSNRAMARIPFELVGGPCELVCERGLGSVPLLMPILSLTALAKGFVAVHASAFVHHGIGILMAGWAGSGKTTALLGFASEGAEFVGDEWILLSGDGQTMCGLPKEIELSSSHLEITLATRLAINRSRLRALEGLRSVSRMQDLLGEKGTGTHAASALRKVTSAAQRRVLPKISPNVIFGSRVGSFVAKIGKVILLISQDDPWVEVQPTPPTEMARRVAHLAHYEQTGFMEHYLAFKFALPEKKNTFIEESSKLQYTLLSRALMAKETYTVRHPYPLAFSALYEAMKPFCESTKNEQNVAVCALP